MKNVAVINNNKVVATGTNDGKIVDKYYTKVNGELYFAGQLVRAEDAELVTLLLQSQQHIIEEAQNRQFQIITIFNNILTVGLDATDYPDIRKQDWFKAIKPKQ